VIDQLPEEESLFLHLRLGSLAAADVDHGTGNSFRVAIAVADDRAADSQPAPMVAAAANPRIHRQGIRTTIEQRVRHTPCKHLLVLRPNV